MQRRWPPWWTFLGLLACASYIATFDYLGVVGPETLGFATAPHPQGRAIGYIQPGMAFDRAGLKVGDIVLSVNGVPAAAGMRRMRSEIRVGGKFEIVFQRGAERRTAAVVLRHLPAIFQSAGQGTVFLIDMINSAVYLILACVIAFVRPNDLGARLGALFLAMWPVALIHWSHGPLDGFSALLRSWPAPLAAVPFLAICLSGGTLLSVGITFFATFPRRLFRAWWTWALIWVPAAYFLFATVYVQAPMAFTALTPFAPPPRGAVLVGLVLRMLFVLAMPAVLVWNYRSLKDASERRRVRVLVLGLAISLLAFLPDTVLGIPAAGGDLLLAYYTSPLFVVSAVLAGAGPFCMGYAIVRHRVFDVRVMVRLGLQYAAARGLLFAAVPVFAGILVLDLLLHANQTLAQVLAQRGWLYLAIAAAALVAHSRQKTWLAALDRRFFRERYNAQQILRGVVEEVRQAHSVEQVAPWVMEQLDRALHPEFAGLVVRRRSESAFRAVASRGERQALPTIQTDSKLMGLARLLGKPIEIPHTDTEWLTRQLPREESTALRASRLEWLFPISLGPDTLEAMLALGRKRSEEPYSQEDQELIQGVTAALGLLLERAGTLPGYRTAPAAGTPSGLPEPIAERYFFQRQLGAGGMGTVYEALDTELERRVAIKMIRAELTESPEAAARFKREARAAAAFTHPNVVTVHDFGVADGGRAYIVMELLEGFSLRQTLRRETRMEAGRAADVLLDVCAAMDAAHQRRLLHRDLKPENIFLARIHESEVAKILDFGIAKTLATGAETMTMGDTRPGQLLGTLKYMSPEQLQGGEPSESWDLWALAVVTYEMLTGAYPFTAAAAAGWQAAVLAGRFTPVEVDPALAWNGFFTRVLAPDAQRRPASARELYSEFNKVTTS